MTVLSVVQSAAMVIGIERPEVLFNSTDRTMLEVQNAINAAVYQILDEYDWQALIKTQTIMGDGALTAFPLPDDYYRMMRRAELYNSAGAGWRVRASSPEEFLASGAFHISNWDAQWAIFGNALNISPARPVGQTVRFLYISKEAVRADGGALKSEFTADTDTFVLPERLLRLCFIANWKRDKGFDYAAEQNEYEIALSYATAADKGPKIIRSGTYRGTPNVGYAWPGELG